MSDKVEGVLKDVLIKEVTQFGFDTVFIVDNLPKSLLYNRETKMIIDYTDPQNRQLLVPDFEVLDTGIKRRTGAKEDVLKKAIERDPNDDAYVFHVEYNEAKKALEAIDRYIQQVSPVTDRIPERIHYAAQPGNTSSRPLARHQIPRVVLPELVSPPVVETAQAPSPRALPEGKEPITNRQVQPSVQERMAKARAAKAAKAPVKS